MRKKILGMIVFAAIVVAAGWNIQQNEQEVKLSDVALENIEALATCEQLLGSCWFMPWNNLCCDAGVNGCAPCD